MESCWSSKELKLPTGTLDRIQECNALKPDKDIVSFEHMLYIWMQLDLLYKAQPFSPSIHMANLSIIEALRAPSVREDDLAEKSTLMQVCLLFTSLCIAVVSGSYFCYMLLGNEWAWTSYKY